MNEFIVEGTIEMKNGKQKFSRKIKAVTENHSKQLVYSLFGSEHRLPRRDIKISKVSPAPKEVKKHG